MLEAERIALQDSIEAIGVQNPITLFDGQVLDGWHRYTAAIAAGVDCPCVDLGDVDPRDFVMAQNKQRRHVTQAQLAMATTAVYEWRPNGDQRSALSAERGDDATDQRSALSAQLPKSSKEMADSAGVGVRSIEQAKAVNTNAAPEVVDAVKRGDIGLPKAVAISKLPKDQQAEAITKPLATIKEPEPDYDGPSDDEVAAFERELADKVARLELLDESDPLKAAMKRIEDLEQQNFSMSKTRDLAMERANEYASRLKSAERKLAAAERKIKELGGA